MTTNKSNSNTCQLNENSATTLSSPSSDTSSEKLTRDDFIKKHIKGQAGAHYFSFKSPTIRKEIVLEPCLDGFDIGIYEIGENKLVGKKTCTKVKKDVYKEETKKAKSKKEASLLRGDLRAKEMLGKSYERSEKVWDIALVIANKLYEQLKNENKLRRWKIINDKNNTGDWSVDWQNSYGSDFTDGNYSTFSSTNDSKTWK